MEPQTYYLAHARLAPVQCVTWGHPLTTGIETIDYFLSSADLEPPHADDHYTEKLVRLSHLTNYYYRPDPPALTKSRSDFGFADEDHVYLCPQNLFKLHPENDVVFGEILRRDPRRRSCCSSRSSQRGASCCASDCGETSATTPTASPG